MQERSVPDRKGCIPEAPEAWQRTHAGTLLPGAVAAFPEDPPDAAREDDLTPMLPVIADRLPEPPPEAPLINGAPPADRVAEPPVVVLGVA